jgi:hypothetical protein
MNYSLFIMMVKEMVSIEEREQPGAALISSSLLFILALRR